MDDAPYQFSRSECELEPSAIAQRSPISIEGLSLILDAPGIDVVIPDREIACVMQPELEYLISDVMPAALRSRLRTFIPEANRPVPLVRELGKNIARSLRRTPPQMGGG